MDQTPSIPPFVAIPEWSDERAADASHNLLAALHILIDRLYSGLKSEPPWAGAFQARQLVRLTARKTRSSLEAVRQDLHTSRLYGAPVSERARVHADLAAAFAAPFRNGAEERGGARFPLLVDLGVDQAVEADLALAALYRLRRAPPLVSTEAAALPAVRSAIALANAMARRHAALAAAPSGPRRSLLPFVAALESSDCVAAADVAADVTTHARRRTMRDLAAARLVDVLIDRPVHPLYGL